MPRIHSFAALAVFALFATTTNALPRSLHRRTAQYPTDNAPAYNMPPGNLNGAVVGPPVKAGAPINFPTMSVDTPHYSAQPATPQEIAPPGAGYAPSGVFPHATGYSTATGYVSPTATAGARARMPSTIRGVNLGNWLVLEKWMDNGLDTPMFDNNDAIDQWTFDSAPGAEAKLQQHWSSFITEQDFKNMKDWALNTVRIPIGYWAYNNKGTPYLQGADAYLEKAIGWAREYGLWVLIDLHGSPGSQNGQEHSGHKTNIKWQDGDNMDFNIEILEIIAEKYGTLANRDVVLGIELVNEPSNDGNFTSMTQAWVQKAFKAVQEKAENKDLYIVSHDSWLGPKGWVSIGAELNAGTSYGNAQFALDVHLYQDQSASENNKTIPEHIEEACQWDTTEFLPKPSKHRRPSSPIQRRQQAPNLPVIVGEFTHQLDVCAYVNGTTTGGTVCTEDGCSCTNLDDLSQYNDQLKDGLRQFWEAQIAVFERDTLGWMDWSLKGPGLWSFENFMTNIMGPGSKVTDRKYPNICQQYWGNTTGTGTSVPLSTGTGV